MVLIKRKHLNNKKILICLIIIQTNRDLKGGKNEEC